MTTRADRSDPAGARASDGGPPDAPGRSARPIGPPVWTIGVAAFLLVGALTMRVLIGNDLDPSAFVAFGEDSPVQTPYGRRLLGDVVTRPGGGHDGQAFFIQANDPWYLHPEENAALLDRPVYRAQRMLFPTLAGLFAAASLSREVMLAFAVGVMVWWWLQHREILWRLVAVPLGAMALWGVYVLVRLAGIEGVGRTAQNFELPFVGLLRALSGWVDEPIDLIVNVVLVVVVVSFVPLALRSGNAIASGALPFVAIAVVLSAEVWAEPFNWSRAVAPIWTALPFAIMARAPRD